MAKRKAREDIVDSAQAERAQSRELRKTINRCVGDDVDLEAKNIELLVDARMRDISEELGDNGTPSTWVDVDKREATRLKIIAGIIDIYKAAKDSRYYIPRKDAVKYAMKYRDIVHALEDDVSKIAAQVDGLDREQRASLHKKISETLEKNRQRIAKVASDG